MVIGIVGLGLIGGSVGLALRKPNHRVLGFDPHPEAGELAQARQCVDELVPLEEVAEADVVFVCSPPSAVIPNLEAIALSKRSETVVTDCASVKGSIVRWALDRREDRFVPGHPMAGHEKSGAGYASPWLFRNAKWLLTPTRHTNREALRIVESLVRDMGATPLRMSPESHDRQVAILSHLPHAMAATLVRLGAELESADIAGGSWRDLTRVGGVDPELWSQILLGNREEVIRVLREAEADLADLRERLETQSGVRAFLEEARRAKEKHEPKPRPMPSRRPAARGKRRP